MAVIIGDYNRKGGVGKTSSIINIGAELASKGNKVLLVDGDSQMNLTQFFFETDEEENEILENGKLKEGVNSLYSVLAENVHPNDAIYSREYVSRRKLRNRFKKIECKIDVLLGTKDMDYLEVETFDVLKKKLELISDEYDYIFIDFPPQHNVITMMYLVACDYILVPLHLAKNSSIYGYQDVIEKVQEAREEYGNDKLGVLGLFYINTQLYKGDQKVFYEMSMEDDMREGMGLFRTTIRHDYASMQTIESERKPLCVCCQSSDIAKDYRELVKEIEEKLKERGV